MRRTCSIPFEWPPPFTADTTPRRTQSSDEPTACVLQDFEALTPNLLARTVETVEGGGLIILLLKTLQSLKQLYTMSMDVHKRFRTEAHQTVTCRFNERLILSLADCKRCLVVNDDLTVLPLSSKTINVEPVNVS